MKTSLGLKKVLIKSDFPKFASETSKFEGKLLLINTFFNPKLVFKLGDNYWFVYY